jgi:hypothetical protein
MRLAGTVQAAASKLISSHRAPSASPDLAAVRMRNCSAFDVVLSIRASFAMNAGTASWGIAV